MIKHHHESAILNQVAGPQKGGTADIVQQFVALATHVVERVQPGLFEANHPPQTVAALIHGAVGASWPARVRLAAFVSDLPSATNKALSNSDLEVLALAPARLGCSQHLLGLIRQYNALAPVYTRLVIERFQEQGTDHKRSGGEVFRLMSSLQEQLHGTQMQAHPMRHLARGPDPTAPRDATAADHHGQSVPPLLSLDSARTESDQGNYSVTYSEDGGDNPYIDVNFSVPVPQPFNSLTWLLDPVHWSTCITQVQNVALTGPGGAPGSGQTMREIINLFAPVNLSSVVPNVQCDLQILLGDVQQDEDGWRYQTMTYSLVSGGSTLLDTNEGYITVYEVPAQGTGAAYSVVVLDKKIRFRTRRLWQDTFSLNPDGLSQLINYWVVDAEHNCGQLTNTGAGGFDL